MKTYTAHLKQNRLPVLVAEGWSWGAAIFGPFWLLAQRAWIPAIIVLALSLLSARLAPAGLSGILALGIGVLCGVLGRDLVRWTLDRRGYVMAHVLAARDEETALGRLLTARPDVAAAYVERLR